MKPPPPQPDFMKRKLLTLLASLPLLTACESPPRRAAREASQAHDQAVYDALSPEEKRLHESLRKKFRGLGGVVLVLSAYSKKEGVIITNEKGITIASDSQLGPGQTSYSTYGGGGFPIPKTIRATWRVGKFEQKPGGEGWVGGTIIGDYTVPVAEHISDSVLDYIRKNGGALRLKIMLKDDGILIGWDVEKSLPIPGCKPRYGEPCTGLEYFVPGGDFKEAKIYNGKVVQKGWYIDKNGQKIETDY
jgi:hypothetical protein